MGFSHRALASRQSDSDANRKTRLWSFDFVLVLAISLLTFIVCQGNNNGTPIYVAESGGSNFFAGILILIFSLSAAVARIVLGRIIDFTSRQKIMIVGVAMTLAGTFGPVLMPGLEWQPVLRALQGGGFGTCSTAASTAAADIIPIERLGEGLGYFGLGQSLGMVIGPTLAVFLVTMPQHTSLFMGLSIVCVLLFVFVLACRYEKHPDRLDPSCAYRLSLRKDDAPVAPRKGGRFSFRETFELAALPGAIPMLVICLAFSIITNYVSKYGVEQGMAAPGAFFICAAITMTLVRLLGGRLIDEIPPVKLLFFPVVCGIVCFAILALTSAEWLFYVAGALFGLSMGMSFPLFNTVSVRCAPMERRGAATALYLLANDLGVGFGAVVGGLIIDAIGYTSCFWSGVLYLIGALAVAGLMIPRRTSRASGK